MKRLLLLLAVAALPALAQVPAEDEVRFGAVLQTYKTINGPAETDVKFGGEISVWGPLALGQDNAPLEVGTKLRLGAQPGQDFQNLSQIELVDSVSADLFVAKRIGSYQTVTTRLVGFWGFATAVNDNGEVQPRTLRRFGGGVLLRHAPTGSEITVAYGRDQAAGEAGLGQWMLEGRVPLVSDDILLLGARAILSAGNSQTRDQRDSVTLWVGTDLAGVFGRLKGGQP